MVQICVVVMHEHFLGMTNRISVVVATDDKHEARKAAAAQIREDFRIRFAARDIPMANITRHHMLPGSAFVA